jgi:RNA polymerase sigma factor (sigma-70 family)
VGPADLMSGNAVFEDRTAGVSKDTSVLGIPRLALDDEDLTRVEELAGEGERALGLLEHVPVAQRKAVQAHVLEDRGYRELATELGCSEQVVRQHVSRGLKRLRALIEERE